ncbi:MAG: tetratricopeptide repeat protein [Sedimenticola sp.]
MSIRYSFFATLLLVVATLQADPMLDAEKIYHQGNYDKAYTEMRSLAKKGEVDAQYYLGAMLVDGLGVDANSKKGVHWLKQAVKQEHAEAAIMLSKMYLSGRGVPMDVDKGVHYMELGESFKSEDEIEDCD